MDSNRLFAVDNLGEKYTWWNKHIDGAIFSRNDSNCKC